VLNDDGGRERLKGLVKILNQSHFVQHKCCMDWPGIEPGLCGERPATDRQNNCLNQFED
jgi:hypothetical protein